MVIDSPRAYPANIIVYDGVCKLCHAWVNFLLAYDKNEQFHFCSAQSGLGEKMMAQAGFSNTGDSLIDYKSMLLVQHWGSGHTIITQKSEAFLRTMSGLGWPYKLALVFRIVPPALRDLGYDYVARNRYRWFGKYHSCRLPDPDLQQRFID